MRKNSLAECIIKSKYFSADFKLIATIVEAEIKLDYTFVVCLANFLGVVGALTSVHELSE